MSEPADLVGEAGLWIDGPMECWKCKRETVVTGVLALPPIFGSDFGTDEPVCLKEISGLSPALVEQAAALNSGLRHGVSRTIGEMYLMNDCAHCDAKINDSYVFKADGPLLPEYDEEQRARLVLTPTAEPIWLTDAAEVQSSAMRQILRAHGR